MPPSIFVLCNSVIQHIPPDLALQVTLPELARVLKSDGILQLTFKSGNGIAMVYDKDYAADRAFQLYDVDEVIGLLQSQALTIIPVEGDKLGGVMHFTDPKPMEHCALFARKAGMNRLPAPRDLEDITPHWLTQALASHGASKPRYRHFIHRPAHRHWLSVS